MRAAHRVVLSLAVVVLASSCAVTTAGVAEPIAAEISRSAGPATSGPESTTETTADDPTSEESTSDPSTPDDSTAEDTTQGETTPEDTPPEDTTPAGTSTPDTGSGEAVNDPDAPGPESGPKCSADKNYVNEAPTGLRPDVIVAWNAAKVVAKRAGVTMCINDGKRSRAQQQAQYDAYVKEYGKEVADQLVLPPNKSAHVDGIAIDVQPAEAYQWLQATKGSLGFCRRYDNEAWHFEYEPSYVSDGCPARLPKPQR